MPSEQERGTIKPALWCDHGQWQVTQDETCLYLPRAFWSRLSGRREPRWSYWRCRLWCVLHGYGWLPVILASAKEAPPTPRAPAASVPTDADLKVAPPSGFGV